LVLAFVAIRLVARSSRDTGAPIASRGYTPRDATGTVLHQVVREHLETFLECGIWSRGFVSTH
jgi:hypothetical protein